MPTHDRNNGVAVLANKKQRDLYLATIEAAVELDRQKDELFGPLTMQLAIVIAALRQLRLALVNRPRLSAEIRKITLEAEPVLRQASKVIEAEQAQLRG